MDAANMTLPLQEGVYGKAKLTHFEVSKDDALSSMMHYGRRYVPPGRYWRLVENGTLWMSDTPAERQDCYPLFRRAQGRVLINGLGLGYTICACLQIPAVTEVWVVEKSKDVLGLISPFYQDPRVTFIHDDALAVKFPVGTRFGAVWHDIWADLCEDNLPEVTRLKRKYGRRCDWQGAWAEDLVKAHARRFGGR